MAKNKKWYYAVFIGRRPGIYETWYGENGAQAQIEGFSNAIYKKFISREGARNWLQELKSGPSLQNSEKKSRKTLVGGNKTKASNLQKIGAAGKPANRKNLPEVTIYTDGACKDNPGPGGYGVVLLHKGREKELKGGFRLTTNNRMEIFACIEGLRALKNPCAVTLFSDSKYVVDAMEKGWVKRWKANKWYRTKDQQALNIDLWKQLLDLCEMHDVAFNWVKGHAGDKFNERCDQLAVEAASKNKLPPDDVYERSIKKYREKNSED